MLKRLQKHLITRENVFALILCIVLLLLVIVTAESAPQWIYQGF
jgi:predicted PurR-regulated permease PerM